MLSLQITVIIVIKFYIMLRKKKSNNIIFLNYVSSWNEINIFIVNQNMSNS